MLATIGLAFVVTFIAVLSTSVYLHRAAAHGALTLHPLALEAFKFFIWLTTGTKPWQWVAVHRKHHKFTDEPGDPHSPYLEGFWRVQLWDIYYYVREARRSETVRMFAADILDSRTWLDRHVLRHGAIGLALGILVLCWLLGPTRGLIAAGIHAILYVFVLLPSVNGLGHHKHWLGYQQYRGRHVEKVYNNWFMAIATAGEGFHHNHHWKQSLARFGHRWWELDFGWYAVVVLEKLGLATNVKRPPT